MRGPPVGRPAPERNRLSMPVADLPAIRRRLQRALLAVLRREAPGLALAELEACLGELEAGAEEPAARELWNAASSLARGLRSDGDPLDQASLRLLGQLDRALRTQILDGEQALAEASFDALAAAFREHPRSLDAGTGSAQLPGPEALSGLVAAMTALSGHPAWSGAERAVGAEPGGDSPPLPLGSAAAPAAAAGSDEDRDPDYDSADLVPLVNLHSRLAWVVRQSGRDLARPAELYWVGNARVPRARLRPLLPHLECVARNAVYLGVASPGARAQAGLPALAQLELAARADAGGAVLELSVDGLAVDLQRLRRRGDEAGLLNQPKTGISELLALLLQPGFSTAHRATQVAGYGVGLDTAAAAFAAVHGRLELALAADGGLRIEMLIPG